MYKVYVVIFGLVAVVPVSDSKVMTLLLDTSGLSYSTGDPAPAHAAFARFGNITLKLSGSMDLTVTPPTPQDSYKANLRQRDAFPQVKSLHEPAMVKVKAGCTGGAPQKECLNSSGGQLLSGRVQLVGGWTLRPIGLGDNSLPKPTKQDRSIWGFNTLDKKVSHLVTGAYAEAFAFEITVPDLKGVGLQAGDQSFTLSEEAEGSCKNYDPSSPKCAIILITNRPTGVMQVPEPDADDMDFDLYYNLLAGTPSLHYVPTLLMKDMAAYGPGNSPGSKCFGTFIEPYQ